VDISFPKKNQRIISPAAPWQRGIGAFWGLTRGGGGDQPQHLLGESLQLC
jgi:hypothetical protein